MDSKSLAAETCSRYFSLVDSSVDHSTNVMNHLKLLVLEVTSAILLPVAVGDERSHQSSSTITISKRGMARFEAFIDGVSAAIPNEPLDRARSSKTTSSLLTDGNFKIFPFLTRNTSATTSQHPPSVETTNHGHTSQQTTIRRYVHRYPQIDPDDLCTRLLLYIRSIQRIYNTSTTTCRNNTTATTRQHHPFIVQECNAHQEPCRILFRTRVDCICRAFIANVSCITSVQPVLLTLLGSTTRELLAVSVLADDLWKAMKRVSVEYEMKTSFASMAFLSSPQQAAQSVLFPLVVSYLKYIRNDWRRLVFACQVEEVLSASINPILRQTFKGTEFTSIGHLLQVIHDHQELLNNIPLPSFSSFSSSTSCSHLDDGGTYEDDSNNKDIKQALVDLRREVITVNGIILSAPAHSKKQLVQNLCDALHHQINPASTTHGGYTECKSDNYNEETIIQVPSIEGEEQHSADVSSDDSSVGSNGSTSSHNNSKEKEKKRRFDLKTIDKLTLRLLMASCRTGAGGDAFFVIQDLFGDDDVVIVPSAMTSARKINKKTKKGTEKMTVGTIEIIVLMSSVVIKVHGRYSVYPRNHSTSHEFCEPLIQLRTTTSETIALQTIRVCDCGKEKDSNGKCSNGSCPYISKGVDRHSQGSMEDGIDAPTNTLLLKERITETTGNRILSIRPARYKKLIGVQKN